MVYAIPEFFMRNGGIIAKIPAPVWYGNLPDRPEPNRTEVESRPNDSLRWGNLAGRRQGTPAAQRFPISHMETVGGVPLCDGAARASYWNKADFMGPLEFGRFPLRQAAGRRGGMYTLDQMWKGRALFRRPGAAVLCLLLIFALAGDRTQAASAAAAAEFSRPEAAEALAQVGDAVVPLGRAVGIQLFSDGVLVVGLSSLDTPEGPASPGRTSGLRAGDVITHMNGNEVDTIEEVQDRLAQRPGEKVTLQVQRGEESLQLSAQAVKTTAGNYQLGVWLRDSMAGIGTLTFYDPASGVFAALGHGINDVDTARLMPLETGSILGATVSDVRKGTAGQPGELHGDFDLTANLGELYANTDQGIFGHLAQTPDDPALTPVPVAAREEVQTGPAVIRSNIAGDQIEEYSVEIVHLYPETAGDSRNLMLRVTDPRLLDATGGIVQGMSGSPILQNGKLVGAVTHVLVNDPTRGYGILAETMLEAAGHSQSGAV